jgi:hypothetical protein
VGDYYRVTQAMELRAKQTNDAKSETMRIPQAGDDRLPGKPAAEVKKVQVVHQAEAASYERIKSADAEKSRFLARYQARNALTISQELRLLQQAVDAVQGGQAVADAYRDYERGRRELITLQIMVTDFRLFWDALSSALAGREKIIIDADKVPGRRHLLLVDPEQFRLLAPTLKQRTTGDMGNTGQSPP